MVHVGKYTIHGWYRVDWFHGLSPAIGRKWSPKRCTRWAPSPVKNVVITPISRLISPQLPIYFRPCIRGYNPIITGRVPLCISLPFFSSLRFTKQKPILKTNSSPLKKGHPKKDMSSSNHQFSEQTVSFRDGIDKED